MRSADRDRLLTGVCAHLSAREPAEVISLQRLRRLRLIPPSRELNWGPDWCIQRGNDVFLFHMLGRAEIPTWVSAARSALRAHSRASIVAIALDTREFRASRLAQQVTETCKRDHIGLLCQTTEGFVTILPPHHLVRPRCPIDTEYGHIPSWILERLVACTGFSEYFRRCLARFATKYRRLTRRRPNYDTESDVLTDFLRDVRKGDPQLYLPLDTFHELKAWERRSANVGARDHYFHTFNNLLLGYCILGETFADRSQQEVPDAFIIDTPTKSRLKPWEALWFLTCLNHDPGYIGEKFWPTVYANFGLSRTISNDRPFPRDVAEVLENGWDTDLKESRSDLLDLYNRVARKWFPPSIARTTCEPFDSALRLAYFDGKAASHSLLSGLNLIRNCIVDRTQNKKSDRAKRRSLVACDIAALSMLFHDPRCRNLLLQNGVPPIPFEQLPYASLLIFVDALQDDRRDIAEMQFSSHGVLNELEIRGGGSTVDASVCLYHIPDRYWAPKILEYHDALHWLNKSSSTHFSISCFPKTDF